MTMGRINNYVYRLEQERDALRAENAMLRAALLAVAGKVTGAYDPGDVIKWAISEAKLVQDSAKPRER